jgi:hypothetical protein
VSGRPENPYRAGSAALDEPTPRGGHLWAWSGVLLAVLPLGVALLWARQFGQVFSAFGADLPLLTRLVVDWPLVLAVPAALMALWRLLRPGGLRQAPMLFATGLAIAVLLSVAVMVVLYLPIFQLASTV